MKFTRIEDLDPHKSYKVCQITIDSVPSMYFVEDGHGYYHKDILNEVLTKNGLSAKVLGDEGLAHHGEGFVVEGMGGAIVYSEKYIMLFGNSVYFDMGISNAHAEKYTEYNPEWRFNIPTPPEESLI